VIVVMKRGKEKEELIEEKIVDEEILDDDEWVEGADVGCELRDL